MNDASNYRDPDLYDKIISWRALLRAPEIFSTEKSDGFVHNIYGETCHQRWNSLQKISKKK